MTDAAGCDGESVVEVEDTRARTYSDIIAKIGVPAFICIALLYWIAVYLLNPLIDRQMKFMDSIEATNKQQADSIKEMTKTQDVISQTLTSVKETEQNQERILEKLTQDKRSP